MKKFLSAILILALASSVALAGQPSINKKSLTAAKVATIGGYQFLEMQVKGQQINPSSYIEWQADEIAGYSSIDFYVTSVSSGNAVTLSATPVFMDGTAVTAAQTITTGTALTDIRSGSYLFRFYNNVATTTNVTFNFLIAD